MPSLRYPHTPILQYACLALSLLLVLQMPLQAAPGDPDAKNPPAAPAAGAMGTREPMVEVSVDSLEIDEGNTNTLGIIWGKSDGSGGVTPGQINGLENTAFPALLTISNNTRSAINEQIDFLIQNNQARVLANPTLLTKSGFEATFTVGGEIPYPTVGQGGVSGVEFKKYGVTLKILPQITPRQTIEAQINTGVSSIDNSVAIQLTGASTPVPGLTSNETGSKVEVKDGETVVLSGIKESNRSKTITRVPVLGYIPLVGILFRHTSETVTQKSLVLFVTFRLVKN